MRDKFGRISKIFEKLRRTGKDIHEKAKKTTETVLKDDRLKETVKSTKEAMKKSAQATSKAVQYSTKKIQETTDVVTGTKHLELLNERLLEQQKFNDAVATRVLDILDRLEKLELRVNELKTEKSS